MGTTTCYDFDHFTPEYEKVVEIYNAWGSSECSQVDGNPRPISSTTRKGIKEAEGGSIRSALNKNCRFGFVAGGYDDRGIFSELFDSDQVQYSPGLTAILATQHTRDGLIQALNRRSCYATTGPRIVLGFFIANAPIGSELNTKAKPGLAYNRHITGYVVGTAPIKEIALIRNGVVWHTYKPNACDYIFTLDDSEMFAAIALDPKRPEGACPFIYYYVRVMQEDGHLAWSSPIWVDEVGPVIEKKKKG